MYQVIEASTVLFIGLRAHRKLTKVDYDDLIPEPFVHAECRFFDRADEQAAWRWLKTGAKEAGSPGRP